MGKQIVKIFIIYPFEKPLSWDILARGPSPLGFNILE
jgi:hypothetical protein